MARRRHNLAHHRRGWSRRALAARCYVQALDPSDPSVSATVDNIGFRGMFVTTDQPPPAATEVRIDVLPQRSAPLRVRAQVVHVSERGFGCTFTGLSPDSAAALRQWLSAPQRELLHIDAAPPAR